MSFQGQNAAPVEIESLRHNSIILNLLIIGPERMVFGSGPGPLPTYLTIEEGWQVNKGDIFRSFR